MAQQKMHATVQSSYSGYQEVSEGEKGYSLRKSLVQDNLSPSSEDCEISYFKTRDSDERCAVLTLFEPVRWKIIALPLQCLDQSSELGTRAPVNMDGLQLVSPSSINSFKVDRPKAPKGPPCDVTYSIKSCTRSFPGSDVRHQSRNRTLTNKVTKLNKFPMNSSSHSSVTYSNSDIILHSSDPFKSSVIVNENSRVDKGVKRNSRKKASKKGKQNKKLSPSTVFTEPEVFSEDYRHCSSTSLSSGNNDIDHSDGLVSYATSQDESLSESRGNMISSESPRTSTSYTDEGDVLEAKMPSRVGNFPGEPPVIDSEVGIKMEDQRFSINGGLEERHNLQSICSDGIHLNGFSDMHNSQVLDSVSVGSNSDISTGTSPDTKTCDKANNNISLSEAWGITSRKGQFSLPKPYNGYVDFCDCTEGCRHVNQGFDSAGMQVVATGKKVKQAKIVRRGSSACRHGTTGNLHGRTGKENNHSVWQRVQKKVVDESNSELLKEVSAVCSQPPATLNYASLLRRNSNVAAVNMLSKTEDNNKQLKDKFSRKSKRKTSPVSKKEYSSYSRKGLYPSKVCSNVRTEIGIQHNEMLDASEQVNEQKRVNNISRSCSQIGCPEFGDHSSSIKSLNSESFCSSKDRKHNVEPHESVCNTIFGVETHNKVKSLAKSGGSSDKMKMREVRSPIHLPHLLCKEVAQREKDVPVAEHSKQNQISGSFSQKWIPIGTKDPQNTTSARCSSFLLGQLDRQGAEDWTLRNNINQKAASHSHDLVASSNVRMRSMAPTSESITTNEDNSETQKLRNMNADAFHKTSNEYVTAACLTSESKALVETDSNSIAWAVNEASRMQLASEAVWMASGSPIAEFERLLHFSSPVICHSLNLISCKDCSLDQVGSSLCRHETPSISLGCLWQWYEKHGSFGLEIRAEDFEKTKRLGVDRFSFRAYFVPLLSAIQLFSNSKCHSMKNGSGISTSGIEEASKTVETLRSSTNVGHLPIYSLLVPQPGTAASAKPEEDSSVPSVDVTCSNDPELLFEYFESEQPWQRRPLYEKIQELVNGDRLSQHQVYGDPSNLNSINLQDLHPRSWYSVAWYPIYRIPDSNLRAAFLTYHSLGHMIRRSAKVDSANTESFIVSPVVGLQSYNTQGECWFQLRPSAVPQGAENPNLNPSGILKERLRTLEKTASLVARAVINKGDQKSVNRHPDYEFFLSRRRNGLA